MNLIGTTLVGIYVVVATRSASPTSGESGGSAEMGVVNINCGTDKPTNTTVSKPDTTVRVTFPGTSSEEEEVGPGVGGAAVAVAPAGPARRGGEGVSGTPEDYIYDANCSEKNVLSKVCPGATVETTQQDGEALSPGKKQASKKGTIVTLRFPQLPASQQVVCVKCPDKTRSTNNCKALITVAAAPPQGPQACAVGDTSITLEINKAGGSAQFKCGDNRKLEPPEPTKAYADDCSTVETLKDMTRSDGSKTGYVTVTVDKVKKKKLCYLCQQNVSSEQQRGEQDGPCKVYVQVSGSTKFPSSVPYGFALPCLAAMLRLT